MCVWCTEREVCFRALLKMGFVMECVEARDSSLLDKRKRQTQTVNRKRQYLAFLLPFHFSLTLIRVCPVDCPESLHCVWHCTSPLVEFWVITPSSEVLFQCSYVVMSCPTGV